MLTVKSDDVTGRTKMYKNIVDGDFEWIRHARVVQRVAERGPVLGSIWSWKASNGGRP
jgi:DNA-directed RNA polymerase beta subunit